MYIAPLLLFATTFSSGLIVFLLPRVSEKRLKLLLTFGGSYLFSITLLHLIPDLFHRHHLNPSIGHYLLAGFLLQVLLDIGSKGIAHGHIEDPHPTTGSLFFLLSSLSLHSILEGALLGINQESHTHHGLFLAILLHKVPAAIVLTTILYHQKRNNATILCSLLLFSLATPFATLSGQYLYHTLASATPTLLAISALTTGGLLHLATTILFESDPHHRPAPARWAALLLGALCALISS